MMPQEFKSVCGAASVAPALRNRRAAATAVFAKFRALAPYAMLELVLPGGSLMALLLWLYRRQKKPPGYLVSLNLLL
jgi:hypothetical protein